MKSILVGIDGSSRGEKALHWACRMAMRSGATLDLVAVVSPEVKRMAGSNTELISTAIDNALGVAVEYVKMNCPDIEVTSAAVEGDIVEALVNASENHDMVVLGTHHTRTLSERVWGAKGLRVSVSTTVPTAIVPSDWSYDNEGCGIVVGIGPDDVSTAAADLGVRVALSTNQPVELVSAWGVPALLTRPAKVMGGGLAPVGVDFQHGLDVRVAAYKKDHPELDISGNAIEGPAPTQVLLERSRDASLLVLGTHARSMVGRALFGSVTYGCLARLTVPTIIVPTNE